MIGKGARELNPIPEADAATEAVTGNDNAEEANDDAMHDRFVAGVGDAVE